MALNSGTTLGAFEISGLLGVGGMGEVYRARDTKLGREVAIKVLPKAFAKDENRLARFEREAKLLAALDHPNIAGIHELQEAGGIRFLVMQLAEGTTLAERISLGSIPVEEALPLFAQIAEALESAHEQGIVHRDLKPANIKVTDEGRVKLLDFGLAKALGNQLDSVDGSEAPTLDPGLTAGITILGTPAYMSPEQARGQKVDKRTDIWAFGCCLYEAITGEPPFRGETTSDVLAKVLQVEPDWKALSPTTPFRVRDLLRQCLQKEPRRRLRDIGDAWLAIDQTQRDPLDPSFSDVAGKSEAPETTPPAVKRYSINLPSTQPFVSGLALSPDGMLLVYVSSVGGQEMLVTRRIDRLEVRPIPGTEGARRPFFSPDGRWIGFIAQPRGVLKKVSVDGGDPITLVDDRMAGGASWGEDNTIVFSSDSGLAFYRISAEGGRAEVMTELLKVKEATFYDSPHLLPRGKGLLFRTGTGAWMDLHLSRVVLAPFNSVEHIMIGQGNRPRFVPSGHLVYSEQGKLTARSFDLERLKITGLGVSVTESRMANLETVPTQYAYSMRGSLIYAPVREEQSENRALVWVDRAGNEERVAAPRRAYDFVRISPDHTKFVASIDDPRGRNVWIFDLKKGTQQKLTFESLGNFMPIWTPDGARVVFSSSSMGRLDLFWKSSDGSGSMESLVSSPYRKYPWQFSPDGRFLVYIEITPETGFNIAVLSMEGKRESQMLLGSPSNERHPTLSPDGRWIAYTSDESGQNEVFVQPFPNLGGKWQVSTDGGTRPCWAHNGRELFYLRGNEMMMIPIETESPFVPGPPRLLFEGDYFMSAEGMRVYDVSGADERFLMIKKGEGTDEPSAQTELIVVENWFEELKRLAPPTE